VEFRILGPLEVLDEGVPVPLGTLKERVVLAVLLLHANEVVSRERLIDELWGASPPPTAKKAVSVYLSKLRKTLARNGEDTVASVAGGYRLLVDPELLDADRVRRLVAAADEQMAGGESEAASRLLREALALWRGPSLAGLPLESFGRHEVAQLDELRLTVLMDRIDCDLALGRHEHAVTELSPLVREHPLRERLRAQQMLALYRSDRQADALDAYREARHALIDELGIEPSESLQRLQQAILRHDPTLELPAGTAAANGAVPAHAPADDAGVAAVDSRARPRWPAPRRRYLLVGGLAALAAVAAPVAVLSTSGGGQKPPSGPVSYVEPDSFARIDPTSGKVVWDVAGGNEPGPLALGRNTLWIVQRGGGTIEPYDLRIGRLRPPVPVPAVPFDVVADADGKAWVSDRKPVVTWVAHGASGTGTSAVPTVTRDVAVPLPAAGAEAIGGGYVWVIAGPPPLRTGNRVSLIDVHRHTVASTIRLGGQTTAIAYGYGSAWIGTFDPGHSTARLWMVRPGSDRPRSVRLETDDGAGPLAVAVGDGSVWVLTSTGTLVRVDPERLRIVGRISMSAQQPDLLVVRAGSVWTADHTGYSLSQVDPRRNRVVRTVPLGSYTSILCGIAATRDALFVAVGEAHCG
jgi:DNA-binding SARP family transcriptional activator/streptogramin lyase